MTSYQRAKRIAFWRGFAVALSFFAIYIFALGLADRLTNG